MKLGVCYYPEHWPEAVWQEDAQRMQAVGIKYVRIGEFAWSRVEPKPGEFDWGWMDRAIDTLHKYDLKVVLGTPTATPPKWLCDQLGEDMYAKDVNGQIRGFGSRKHFDFSSDSYLEQAKRITRAYAERYGQHPAVAVWQTDNEYGCHDTILSYSENAKRKFHQWLENKYQQVEKLNTAWGNVFWSMEYNRFDEIELPNLAVTEINPSHLQDFYRFSSDQVVRYNKAQVDIIRELSPGRDIHHNYMGYFADFDHFDVGEDLDIATWDSYPLGFLDQSFYPDDVKHYYARTGHPDFAGLHHDLYRAVGKGRLWVQEQQPGPVNWAPHNPAPLPGIVRLWTWEGFAHGAEVMAYFRWRQAPFAQEQMHAGLNLPNGEPDVASVEAQQVSSEIAELQELIDQSPNGQADIALVFDYDAYWTFGIQPQGQNFRYMELVSQYYTALRKLGQTLDIVSPKSDLTGYKAVVIPALAHAPQSLVDQIQQLHIATFIGPRSGSKDECHKIPAQLAPGPLQQLIPLKVTRVESLRDGFELPLGEDGTGLRWREYVSTKLEASETYNDGVGALYQQGKHWYLAGITDDQWLTKQIKNWLNFLNFSVKTLPKGVRVRRLGNMMFVFNYSQTAQRVEFEQGKLVLGSADVNPADLAIWHLH